MIRPSVVWFTTFACNFKCDYCWEVQGQKVGEFASSKFISADRWISAFRRLNPRVLAISGGEPFLLPGLVDVIASLNDGTDVGLTSNLSHSLLEFCERVSPSMVRNITASYHPTENGSSKLPMNREIFLGRALLLKEHGFNVTVNIVAWPETIWLIPELHETFLSHGFSVHIEPYASMAYRKVNFTRSQQELLSRYVVTSRSSIEESSSVLCSGGVDHLSVQPDGSAWRCILERQQLINQIGNILDSDFELTQKATRCDQRSQCAGCDRDFVSVVPVTL